MGAYRPRGTVAAAMAALCLLAAPAAAQQAGAGRAAIAKLGCTQCHSAPGFERSEHGCVGCHQHLLHQPRSGLHRAPHAEHFVEVPDLGVAGARLTSRYLVQFLQHPHDVRPRLDESMPRLPVTEADARAIAGYLKAHARPVPEVEAPAPSRGNVSRGRHVFHQAGCTLCHVFGNAETGDDVPDAARAALRDAVRMAPNLRFVRDRMDPAVALAWIRDPKAIDPHTRMPQAHLSDEDALAVRDFLYLADPGRPAAPRRPLAASDLVPLDRPVRFADVRRIFGRSCIHCHAHTTATGIVTSLGFAPSALDLSTYEGVMAGALRPDGTRVSIVESRHGAPPPLLARLLRRHAEARRDLVTPGRDPLDPPFKTKSGGEPVGMPLGLPPLPRDDLRVIATWIAQGTPR